MTTKSALKNTGISISVARPLVQSGEQVDDYTDVVNSYHHSISASGGYTTASFTLSGNADFANDWLQNGLGRHITVHGSSMDIIWEGFVNQLDINMGAVNFSRGPLTNVVNRVSAIYTEIIEYPDGTVEPVTGVTTETLIEEDLESQEKYGIWEKVLNIGEVLPADAIYIRDLYLVENANPEGNTSISISGNEGDISITVSCRGYIDWINNYVYNDDGENQYVYTSELIKTILGYDPNSIISTEYDKVDENLVIYPTYTNENKMAKTLIDDIVNYGGGSDDRWLFGIYANRKASFKAIPTSVEYLYHKTSLTQEIETVWGEIVNPWNVLPGKWVAVPEFMSSSSIKVDYPRNDPRVFFTEEVSYTAPDQVTISGQKISKLSQYMAKLGLGGM